MRITLEIDDDVYRAVKELALRRKVGLGKVLSALARSALAGEIREVTRNGIPLFPDRPDGQAVTIDLIKSLGEGPE